MAPKDVTHVGTHRVAPAFGQGCDSFRSENEGKKENEAPQEGPLQSRHGCRICSDSGKHRYGFTGAGSAFRFCAGSTMVLLSGLAILLRMRLKFLAGTLFLSTAPIIISSWLEPIT